MFDVEKQYLFPKKVELFLTRIQDKKINWPIHMVRFSVQFWTKILSKTIRSTKTKTNTETHTKTEISAKTNTETQNFRSLVRTLKTFAWIVWIVLNSDLIVVFIAVDLNHPSTSKICQSFITDQLLKFILAWVSS